LKFILHKEKNMEQMKKQALAGVDAKYDVYAEANDRIWEYAKRLLRNLRAWRRSASCWSKNGFAVEKGVGRPVATAFTGTWGSGSPVIGYPRRVRCAVRPFAGGWQPG
jgi:metal-dependent amidase/aminoacylase/carboxypeptidase family protein